MTDYPTLREMGVTSFEKVTKYTLRHESNADVLKIYYNRPFGSFRSRSKKFTFMRGLPIEAGNSANLEKSQHVSDQLLKVLEELRQLTNGNKETTTKTNPREELLDSIEHLEKVMNSKIAEIREQIDKLER